MNGKRTYLPGLALLAIWLIWGYNWVVMKKVVPYVGPFDFAALRTLFGAASLFVVALATKRPLAIPAPGHVALLGLLQIAAFTGLIQWALVDGGAGKTAVLVYTMPFWLIPLAWVFVGERVRGVQWLAVALALAGLVFVLEPWRLAASASSSLLALGAGLAWAAATIVAKRLRARHDYDLLTLTAWQTLFGALALGAVSLAVPSAPIVPSPYFFGALAFNAIPATGLAWTLWLYVLHRLPAGVAGLSSLGIPAIGVLAGWAQLGEVPSRSEFAGMGLIALALALLSVWSARLAARAAGRGASGATGPSRDAAAR